MIKVIVMIWVVLISLVVASRVNGLVFWATAFAGVVLLVVVSITEYIRNDPKL